MLQRAFDGTTEEMGLRAPTIATPSLLKLVLALGFRMEIRDDLTMGIHPFVLGQHTATFRKFLCGQADRYAIVASGTGAPSLDDVEILPAPDGVTLRGVMVHAKTSSNDQACLHPLPAGHREVAREGYAVRGRQDLNIG